MDPYVKRLYEDEEYWEARVKKLEKDVRAYEELLTQAKANLELTKSEIQRELTWLETHGSK